jgi:hypothetical protein
MAFDTEEKRIAGFLQHPNPKIRILALRVLKEHARLSRKRGDGNNPPPD